MTSRDLFFPLLFVSIFYFEVKGKWVSSSRKSLSCASTSTPTAALSQAHISHMYRTLLASSAAPFLITSSLPPLPVGVVTVIGARVTRGVARESGGGSDRAAEGEW